MLAAKPTKERMNCKPLLLIMLLSTSALLNIERALSGERKETYLSEKDFNQTLDKAHAACANIDLDFSKAFEGCLNQRMEGIYINSRTMR